VFSIKILIGGDFRIIDGGKICDVDEGPLADHLAWRFM
jgi:hypothetical protein